MEVLIKKIRYIQGIPTELTEKAVSAGEIRRGSVVGLDVEFKDCATQALIELRIAKEDQEKLVRQGCIIPVEEVNSIYFMTDDWTNYLENPRCEAVSKKVPLQAYDALMKRQASFSNAAVDKELNPRRNLLDGPIRSRF
jgi:hypothetical protein